MAEGSTAAVRVQRCGCSAAGPSARTEKHVCVTPLWVLRGTGSRDARRVSTASEREEGGFQELQDPSCYLLPHLLSLWPSPWPTPQHT